MAGNVNTLVFKLQALGMSPIGNMSAVPALPATPTIEDKTFIESHQLLQALDNKTTELLQKDCCNDKQTAQFWKYIISEPCTSICEISDFPPEKWGGWWQSSFLKLYIRTLLEVMQRIERKEDRLLLENDDNQSVQHIQAILKNELNIAIGTFHSAVSGDALSQAYQKLIQAQVKYEEDSQYLSEIQRLKLDHLHIHLQPVAEAHFEESKMAFEQASKHFNLKQQDCIEKLWLRVKTIIDRNPGEYYCHSAGFLGHAFYIDFENVGNQYLKATIHNLGPDGNPPRHYRTRLKIPGQSTEVMSVAPFVLYFPTRTQSDKIEIQNFCINIISAMTKTEEEAIELIYDKYGQKISTDEYESMFRNNQLVDELPQTIANCTAKGYLQALRNRLYAQRVSDLRIAGQTNADMKKLDFYYRRLMLSLCVWSKNAFFIRHSLKNRTMNELPTNIEELLTPKNIQFLKESESVFMPFAGEAIWKALKENLSGLNFRPRLQPVIPLSPRQPLPVPTQASPRQTIVAASPHVLTPSYRMATSLGARHYSVSTPLRLSPTRKPGTHE